MLVIDVGSASVGAAVASVSHKHKTLLLEKVTRVPIGAGSKETRDQLQKQTTAALTEILKQYTENYSEVHVVLAAPWHDARIRTIHSKTEKPAPVSEKSVERMVEQYKNEAPPASGNVDVEAVAVQVQVNSYTTSLAQPVTGTHTRVNLYESEMSAALQKEFADTVGTHTHDAPIAFHTFPLVSGAALRAAMLETSFVFIDIGGEVTELGVMHSDGIHFLGSIPIGYWTLVRTMGAEKVGDTRSRLTLLTKDELSPQETSAVAETFKQAFTPWITEFEDMLKEASALVPVPRSVFIMSDTEPAGWFKKGLADYGTMSLAPTLVTNATVQRFVEIGDGGTFDPFLALEALFFHMGEREVVGEPEAQKMVYSKK